MLMLMLMLMRQQLNTWSLKAPKEVLRCVRKTTADVLQSNPRNIEKLFSGGEILERYLAQ